MSPLVSLALDVVIAGLLIATIIYAIRLNRQIEALRDSRNELADLIRGLNDATANADTAVRGLRKAAGDTGEQLQRSIDKAVALRDELQFMVETGDALANRLGNAPKGAGAAAAERNARPAPPVRAAAAPPRPLIDESLMAVARAEAARQPQSGMPSLGGSALGPVPAGRGEIGGDARGQDSRGQDSRGHDSRGQDSRSAGDGGRSPDGDGLSRAERELLQALESRR